VALLQQQDCIACNVAVAEEKLCPSPVNMYVHGVK